MLVNGKWQKKWDPFQKASNNGDFVRQTSSFRHWVTVDGSAGKTGDAGFKAQAGRYHLYVALICPWACRTLMVRKLKGLDKAISYSVVEPALTDQGWHFGNYPGSDHDPLNQAEYMHQIYTQVDPDFTGRATVPVLWDKQTSTIVNNESADIIEMLNDSFNEFAENSIELRPKDLLADMQILNDDIYQRINNGVYRAGFAQTQSAYQEAYDDVFNGLSEVEQRLQGQDFLFGARLTETDIRLFVTLVRFDAAYHGLFKTNKLRIADMPKLSTYLGRIYAVPGVAETVNIDHIKTGYYSVRALNPTGIVPIGPELGFMKP